MAVDTVTKPSTGYPYIDKDANASLDYKFDWTEWLAVHGDNIVSASAAIESEPGTTATPGAGVPVVDSVLVNGLGSVVTVWVSGGTAGVRYYLRCRITTSNTPPRIDDRTLVLKVKER